MWAEYYMEVNSVVEENLSLLCEVGRAIFKNERKNMLEAKGVSYNVTMKEFVKHTDGCDKCANVFSDAATEARKRWGY